MPEGTSTPEREPYKTILVRLGPKGDRLGHEIKQPGESYPLQNTFNLDAQGPLMLGGDRLTTIYFRTESGNVYCIDEHGRLTNANESQKLKGVHMVQLSKEDLNETLRIGKPFTYGKGGTTTKITEIVPMTSRIYDPEYIKGVTQGRTNRILENFNAAFSQIPRGNIPR